MYVYIYISYIYLEPPIPSIFQVAGKNIVFFLKNLVIWNSTFEHIIIVMNNNHVICTYHHQLSIDLHHITTMSYHDNIITACYNMTCYVNQHQTNLATDPFLPPMPHTHTHVCADPFTARPERPSKYPKKPLDGAAVFEI